MHTLYSWKGTEKLKRRNKIPLLSSHHKVAYDILSCFQHCLYAAIQIVLNFTVFTSWHMAAPSCGEMRPGFLAASRLGPRRPSHLPDRSPGTGHAADEVTLRRPAALVVLQFCCLNSAYTKSWLGYRDPVYFTVLKRPCLLQGLHGSSLDWLFGRWSSFPPKTVSWMMAGNPGHPQRPLYLSLVAAVLVRRFLSWEDPARYWSSIPQYLPPLPPRPGQRIVQWN